MDPATIAALAFAGIKLAEMVASSGRRIERPEDITEAEVEAIRKEAGVIRDEWNERVAAAQAKAEKAGG